jgi:hypothetical protein
MTKIIFNYSVYYVSDKDTFIFEKDESISIKDNQKFDMIWLRVYQNGKCIISDCYQTHDKELLNDILHMPICDMTKDCKGIQFGIYRTNKGGCHE